MAMPDPGESDATLVARSRKGDRDAFGELVRRWQRPLFARALRSTGSIEEADDMVQETYLRAWRGIGRFRDDPRFGAWALRILANLAIDRARKRAPRASADERVIEALADPAPGPEQRLLAADFDDQVRAALAALPAGRRREVFRMRFVEGRTINEISQQFGVTVGTVKVHLFRLGRELRRRLAGGKAIL
jgi:RNA polymerase sigma-70 factor (ECF subfamily)